MLSTNASTESDPVQVIESGDRSAPNTRRTRNACDGCRTRRIKCHYHGPACRACLLSDIPCTQDKPRRKRGPVNQYVEAQRRRGQQQEAASSDTRTQEGNVCENSDYVQIPSSITTGGLDQLAPFGYIKQVLNDWFEFIHPVAPILHRDTFWRQLEDPQASREPAFVNLVFSLCSATVATLRSRSSMYGQSITVERCYDLARRNDLSQGQKNDPLRVLTLEWCQTKYNFAVSIGPARGIDSPETQVLMAEAATGAGYLLQYATETQPLLIRELLKRLYWLCFASQCTQGLHGRPRLGFLDPNINIDILRPLEITDAELSMITPGQEHWHGNQTTYIPGLNALSNLFMLWFNSQQGDLTRNLSHLQHHMESVLTALDNIPPELRWRGGLSRPKRSNFGTDVQMVNLYITQIHIRSYLLDQMDRAAIAIGDVDTIAWVLNARQSLVDDMLAIVYQMPEDSLEANGYSLIPKLRDIGLALLSENAGNSVKTLVNLDRLLAKLERLDIPPGSQFDTTSPTASMTNTV